ncbi:MAG: DHH family phosphoesterase, partial [Candidatus Diapherotrites archaeon]|nr:DHH family phosphoesterase [Candidatus Diapherotrites archaeon]
MELPSHVREQLEKVKEARSVLVVSHYDADGVSAAGVLARGLSATGKDYDVLLLRQLYPETLEELPLGDYDHVIFADLGGRYVDQISRHSGSFLVIDHHDNAPLNSPRLFHPSQMGYSPDTEASASTLSALFSYHLYPDPKTLAYGLVGAAGDVQFEGSAFVGLNRVFVSRALRSGVLTLYRDLVLSGIHVKELPWVLIHSDPPLPGLVGNNEAVYNLLERLGFLKKSAYGRIYYKDLSIDERRRLFTALTMHLLRYGWSSEQISSLIGEVYEI